MQGTQKVIIDFYGALNLGDDLFLKEVLSRYPNVTFLIDEKQTKQLPALHNNNLTVFKSSWHTFWGMNRRGFHLDCLCQVGGSIFIEPNGSAIRGIVNSVKMILKRFFLYSSFSHTFILGANWGPCRHKYFQSAFRWLFRNNVEDICFRDKASYHQFKDISNVRYSPDILFSLSMPKVKKTRSVFFSVADLTRENKFGSLSKQAKRYFDWVVNAACLFSKKGYEVILSSFCRLEGDEDAVRLLAARLSEIDISYRIHCYRGNIDEAIEIISSCDVVVATRFHAMVLGIDAGAHVLPVPYSMKTINVLHDIGFDMNNVQTIDNIDPDDMSVCEHVIASDPFPLNDLHERAKGHFLMLDRFLNGR